jgi:hypothetical protein
MPRITLECIRYLRRELPDCRISVEVEKPGRDGLRELAAEGDVVFYSRAWAEVSQGTGSPPSVSFVVVVVVSAGAEVAYGIAARTRDRRL